MKENLRSDVFSCSHLGTHPNDEELIKGFSAKKGQGLERYLRYQAFPDEDSGTMRTYMIRNEKTGELAAYFSLKAGLVSTNEQDSSFDVLPGVELANFAINDNYIDAHPHFKGSGEIIFGKFVVPKVLEAAKIIGVRFIYIFSLPEDRLIEKYMEYGFQRLTPELEIAVHQRLKPRYDKDCIFMFTLL